MRDVVRKAVLSTVVFGIVAVAMWGAIVFREFAHERKTWRDLESQLQVPVPPKEDYPGDWWHNDLDNGTIGRIELGDGEVLRFAFASHHVVGGPDSYTVFEGRREIIRSKGSGAFCCEVEFYNDQQPVDRAAFVSLLRSHGERVSVARQDRHMWTGR